MRCKRTELMWMDGWNDDALFLSFSLYTHTQLTYLKSLALYLTAYAYIHTHETLGYFNFVVFVIEGAITKLCIENN